MENLLEAALYTRSTLMIVPLIPFCFLPVWQDAKCSPQRLFLKVLAAFAAMEAAMFFLHLILPPATADTVNMGLCIFVFFYLYQKEIALKRSHLWFIFMTACLIGSLGFLCYHLVDIFLHPTSVVDDPVWLDSLLIQIAFESFLVLILAWPARKYLGWLVHYFHEETVWNVIWLIPFGFMIFASVFIPYDNSVMYAGRFLKIYSVTILVLSALLIFIYILFYKIAYSIMENQKMIQKTANLEIQAQQYHRLQAYMQKTSRLRHDFRYQLTVIAGMLQKQQYKELEDYLDQYIAGVSDMPVRYCSSSAVNAILNHYASMCRELGITARFNIRLHEKFSVEDIDFCVLLGNLLENAIDGCEPLPEARRRITLKVGQTAEHVIALQISNPYEGLLNQKAGRLLSSKHDGEGQGLKSVQMITEKYNGFLDIHSEDRMFEVKVLLNF